MAKVICAICGKETSKGKTYAIGDGKRACRDHEGVAEKGELRKAQEQRRLIDQTNQHKKPKRPKYKPIPTAPACWVCEKEGINAREFFLQRLVDSEKHSLIHGITNPFTDPDHPLMSRKAEKPVIFALTKERLGEKWDEIYKKVKPDFRMLMDMAGFMGICADCCVAVNFNPLPKVSMDEIDKMMPVTSMIRPALRDEAMRQMGRDN